MKPKPPVHRLAAMYASGEALTTAVRELRRAGYGRIEAYSPRPLEEVQEMVAQKRSPVPAIMLTAGIIGAAGGFGLQVWAANDYALNIGGRPIFSWPAFIPVTFELTVLTSALVGLFAFFWLVRFPRLDHPMFNDPRFARATQDRYFLCVRSDDPLFAARSTRELLERTGPLSIEEVAP